MIGYGNNKKQIEKKKEYQGPRHGLPDTLILLLCVVFDHTLCGGVGTVVVNG